MADVLTGLDCDQCGHAFDPHLMVATLEDPLLGGVMLCPETGCQCLATWSAGAGTRQEVRIPDDAELAQLRARFQA